MSFSVAVAILSLAPVGYMRDVYGPVLNSGSTHTLTLVTLVLLLALVISTALGWVRSRVLAAAAIDLEDRIGARVLDATFNGSLLAKPAAKHALPDLKAIRNFLNSQTITALFDAPLGLIFLFLVFLIDPYMGVLASVGVILVLFVAVLTEKKVRTAVKDANKEYEAAMKLVVDSSRNAEVVQAMGMRADIEARWSVNQNKFLNYQAEGSRTQAISSAISKFVMLLQTSSVLGMGMLLIILGILDPSAGAYLIIGKILAQKAVGPLIALISSWKQVVSARDSFFRLEAYLAAVPQGEEKMELPAPSGLLTVEAAYVGAKGGKAPVLSDINILLRPGQSLGLIGPSGSGKSSLAKTMIGLWSPLRGRVRLDGADIATWDKSELGRYLGYLPQDVELFDGTILENITRFETDIDEIELTKAIGSSGLGPLLEECKEGVNTVIGAAGRRLSGGERQRVGLARAIYGSPRLVVLDEPDANLDILGKDTLKMALNDLKKEGTTVVVVTHSQALAATFDKLLVLGKGRARAYGATEKVLEKLAAQRSSAEESGSVSGATVHPVPKDAVE